jgi:hypothetical protein
MRRAARLRKVGRSVMLAIPKAMLDALDLAPNASVTLSIKAGRLVVDPKKSGGAIRSTNCWRSANLRRGARGRILIGSEARRSAASSSDSALAG